jgi:uncharacterized protein
MLADRFVKDPHEVVKAGDVVRVKVLEVDLKRNRIALTMRMSERPAPQQRDDKSPPQQDRALKPRQMKASPPASPSSGGGALAEAFARARRK